mmetsp:Transcript_18829/g.32417  ORF Transcript_18829/g.32417 Transcript_18829/m.32417 type:complete len:215 (-) Transcript_18829:542-1186(-)
MKRGYLHEEHHIAKGIVRFLLVGGGVLDVGEAGPDVRLNAALIDATPNAEETVLSPDGSPGVGANPVVNAVFRTPADDLDGVATNSVLALLLVNPTLVLREIREYLESSLNRAVVVDLGHDGLNDLGLFSVGPSHLVEILGFVLQERLLVNALLPALFRHASIASCVREASVFDGSGSGQVFPRFRKKSSSTTHVIFVTRYQIFRGQHHLNLVV